MIDFACPHCGNELSVPGDLAGTDLQCDRCGILLSVPLPSDLANVHPDGTLRVSEAVRRDEPGRLRELARVFGTQRVDDDGDEIDNRTLAEVIDLAPIGGPAKPVAPQYDPETGELIRALEIAPPLADLAPPEGAVAGGTATLGYRPAGAALHEPVRVTRGQVPLALFQPMNVFVMGVLVAMHVLMNVGWVVVHAGLIFVVVGPLVMFVLIVGHYGNVVDEVGPTDMDELPRPLRQLSWSDDLWGPFRDVAAAAMLAGMPLLLYAWAAWHFEELPPPARPLALAAAVVTWWFFPALLLTLRTSGSLENLRPDRVLGTMRACGRGYLPVALLGYVVLPLYLLGTFGTFSSMGAIGGFGVWGSAPVTFGILFVALYVAHLFAWQVGLLYRMFQPKFPWVNQEHVRKARRKPLRPLTAAQRAALKAAKQAPPALRRQAAVEALGSRNYV